MKKIDVTNHFKEHRPLYHFSCNKGWLNDPNGLIYHDGYYHMFYQYYPDGVVHGPMHWGHTRSKDLIRWEDLPVALYPDENGTIFSGCMVYDSENTGDFAEKEKKALVAVFTHNQDTDHMQRQYQSLAYSLDDGMTFKKYPLNPVLDLELKDFRDPKVFWHAGRKKWIMLTASLKSIIIFSSSNLKDWKQESTFTGHDLLEDEIWECPDLQLFTDDDQNEKWVLIVSQNTLDYTKTGIRYYIGTFDGSRFQDETGTNPLWMDLGRDNYAAATFADVNDRIIQIGWMNCWAYAQKLPESGFRGCMTLPRELRLIKTHGKYRITQKPVRELFDHMQIHHIFTDKYQSDILLGLFEIECTRDMETVLLMNDEEVFSITADYRHGQITVDRSKCSCGDFGEEYKEIRTMNFLTCSQKKLLIFIDVTSIEIFAADGEAVGTFQYFSKKPLQIIKTGGNS